ncbi:MAG: SEC-C domain-containing protein [Oceanospirillaceae bacterium]|nr:SEC-C domain-containing protein [Oceanospirillaceae bacterium]
MRCPCCSGLEYENCCGPVHAAQNAASPEQLMRSRYSAYALKKWDYLLATWHSSTRPAQLQDDNSQWLKLVIHHSDNHTVEFSAYFKDGVQYGLLHEISNFAQENAHWTYVDGKCKVSNFKPERNDECLCGSGKKFKKCCGAA